ncbi:MAG: hypothetical protein ACRYFU_18480 [Janthinobacterium lividum]
MLRPFDVALLLKLTLPGAAEASFQKLASELHVSSSEVHAAIKRVRMSGLLSHEGPKKVNRSALLELLGHGMKYVYPAVRGELTRGVPTSFAAEPLSSFIRDGGAEVPVWPHLLGKVRGYLFEPLYKHAAEAALADPAFYQLLSLVDALRDGRVRERKIALEIINKRLFEDG